MPSRPPLPDRPAPIARAVHIWTLCAFAFAQPLYDLLGRHSTFFVARAAERVDLWIFAFGLSFALPAAIVAGVLLTASMGRRVGRAAYSLTVIALSALIAMPLIERAAALPAAVVLSIALAAGMGAAIAILRVALVRRFLEVLSPSVLLFPALFLLGTPIGRGPGEPAAPSRVDAATPVVLVVFDCLPVAALMAPDGSIDRRAFPNFAALADTSTWYRNATTVAVDTDWAVPALLTGRYPGDARPPVLYAHPNNLFSWLGRSYRVAAFEYATELCPVEICRRESAPPSARLDELVADSIVVYLHVVVPAPWRGALPAISSDWRGFTDTGGESRSRPARRGSAEAAVAARDPRIFRSADDPYPDALAHVASEFGALRERSLAYVHVPVPHGPYELLPSGRSYALPGRPKPHLVRPVGGDVEPLSRRLGATVARGGLRAWTGDDDLTALAAQRHVLQVGAADRILGVLQRRWQQSDGYERALIIVASDHGESYDGWVRAPQDGNTVHVPLFVRFPGQHDARIDLRNAETIDIVPTIADILDAELPWSIDGRSLLADRSEERARKRVVTAFGPTETAWPDDRLDRALRRLDELVGGGRTPLELAVRGPAPELIGQRTDALEARGEQWSAAGVRLQRVDAVIQQRRALARVDPDGPFVPAYLTGRIAGIQPAPPQRIGLAVAINGVIRATTRSYAGRSSETGFAVMVPEESFRLGANEVEIYSIADPASR